MTMRMLKLCYLQAEWIPSGETTLAERRWVRLRNMAVRRLLRLCYLMAKRIQPTG